MVMLRKVDLPASRATAGRSCRSMDRNHLTLAVANSHPPLLGAMPEAVLHWAEYPAQHVEEMNADIRCDTAGFVVLPFP